MTNIHSFKRKKQDRNKISMVTCYDAWSAKILNQTDIDCILVGDSLAVVMHGFDSTVHATIEMMELHTAAVVRGAPDKFVIADMPFLSCSKGLTHAMEAVQRLMQAGAHAVKIEGADHQLPIIEHIVEAGVPVMGHLGLTPQSIHNLGGHRVQGKDQDSGEKIMKQAHELDLAGCFAVVLECVPNKLGDCVSRSVSVPTIGIGAGPHTDGQVLVLQDLLGADPDFSPKFLRRYSNVHDLVSSSVQHFHQDVSEQTFPSVEESYG
ncbi:MAG: 3-methyl-2-oxobutanoate hydroxymethyltransferase [Gammaproteobacteria bacterium]|jgi:3-methyl-2-oxobutanoate hydroxymethyltransferase|nr:3-methyl-2-oxobutanoate hydroxymethyltransferase [Gammaproteobacteria bacterium]MBT4491695.1 3-methyl-2-oxobutanoate hydroxymethyltransferase [Gammaproteobacteria bacterium]MBT7369067.1 3-methyl-2-oxobutanoate hydroxymethyltransferase [Gammaproteobacteria bacterium]